MEIENTAFDERIRSALESICPGRPAKIAAELSENIRSGGAVARVRLGAARDPVLMAAIADRLAGEPGLKALVVAPGDRDVAGLKEAFDAVGGRAGLTCSTIGRDSAADEADAVIGSIDAIASRSASGTLDARSFELVALSDLDAMADAANAAMLRRALGPSTPSRRVIAFSSDLHPAGRSIARDLVGTFEELEFEAEGERSKAAESSTYLVSAEDKLRLLLGIMKSNAARPFAVFCDVRGTAEDAMRRLRAAGIRVEYILGNLPRKRAVLESVKSGAFEALVMTDEGAEGLTGSWAATVVNWDLPLEAEPYMARLEHLDSSVPRAKVYNFACERYSFGIPAIERALGASLGAVAADESMMAPAEAVVASARPDDRNSRRNPDSGGGDRGSSRRNDDDRRDRGGQYDGRYARAIQADIAAITGGGALSDAKPATAEQDAPSRKRGRGSRARKGNAPKQPAKTAAKGSPRQERPEAPRQRDDSASRDAQPAKQGNRQRRGSRGKSGGARLSDPYSVSMEERLRLYRERYGSAGNSSGNAGGSKPGNGDGGRPRNGSKPDGRRKGPRDGSAPAAPTSSQKAPDSGNKPKGLVGAIRNLFGKRK